MSEDIPRRSRWEISYDILEATSEEEKAHGGKAKKTRIMQGAHLDWRNFQRYFDFLLEHRFIASLEGGGLLLSYRERKESEGTFKGFDRSTTATQISITIFIPRATLKISKFSSYYCHVP
jgi:predicted transcriptional regulator